MGLTVYADFTCPLTFLAHQRARRVEDQGLGPIRWCAVVADRRRPVTGRVLDHDTAAALREAVLAAAQPDERVPLVTSRLSWAGALTASYAESLTDGRQDQLREAFLSALWERGADLSDAVDVRRLVADVMNPHVEDVLRRLPVTPLIPLGIGHDAGMRLAGATTTRLGHPLTTVGYRRQTSWARERAEHGPLPLPLVVTADRQALSGAPALDHLLQLADATLVRPARAVRTSLSGCPERPSELLSSS
jgi:hypothetical protein